jgi:hypothetical protein
VTNPEAGGPSLVGSSQLRIQYIQSCSPNHESISSIYNPRKLHAILTMDPLNILQIDVYLVERKRLNKWYITYVGFEVLAAVVMKIPVLWYIMPSNLFKLCLHLLPASYWFCAWLIL